MSGAAQGGAPTTKAVVSDAPNGQPAAVHAKAAPQLEEDDEFEDFPVEGTFTLRKLCWHRDLCCWMLKGHEPLRCLPVPVNVA